MIAMPRLGSSFQNFLRFREYLRNFAKHIGPFLHNVGMSGQRHERDIAEFGDLAVHPIEIDLPFARRLKVLW